MMKLEELVHYEKLENNIDNYLMIITTPLSTQEWEIYIDFNRNKIWGDMIRYGHWDLLQQVYDVECIYRLLKESKELRRDFRYLIQKENIVLEHKEGSKWT